MNLTMYVLDAEGQPVPERDVIAWSKWMGTGDNKYVQVDEVGRVRIVTVFLGLDHRDTNSEPWMLFDTLVYGGPLHGTRQEYSTKADAIEGHRQMVERVKEARR